MWLSVLLVAALWQCTASLHHMCQDTNTTDNEEIKRRCTACYMETLASLKGTEGSDIVFGANNGKSFDPAWGFGYWDSVPQHTITWVEPVPALFAELTENTKNVPNKILLNKAVRPLSMSSNVLEIFCYNFSVIDSYLKDGVNPLPPALGAVKIQDYWRALCGIDKEEVYHSANIKNENFRGLSLEEQQAALAEVDKIIVKHSIDALTPEEILKETGLKDVRYLQIDVEGLDNDIVKSLPLQKSDFHPDLILYENRQGSAVRDYLEANGYYWCCCFNKYGSNIVAARKDPQDQVTGTPV
eukprot:m.22703 g.22703  ORF g.22703 m.22703 type:complete len:299 (-) comp12782_c0_seq2:352-1248(-)